MAGKAMDSTKEIAAQGIDAGKETAVNVAEGAEEMKTRAINTDGTAAEGAELASGANESTQEKASQLAADKSKEAISDTITNEKETALGGVMDE